MKTTLSLLALASTLSLAACSGSGSGTGTSTVASTPPAISANVYYAGPYYASAQVYTVSGSSTGAPAAASTLTLSGGATALTVDASGNIYVGSSQGVLEYPAGSTGLGINTPTRAIPYDLVTGLYEAVALAVDSAGNIYVQDSILGNILVFSSTANGDVAPIRTINTNLPQPAGLWIDSAGNLYALTYDPQPAIAVYAAGASGKVAPVRTVTGAYLSMTVDSSGNIYGLSPSTGISVYPSGTTTLSQTITAASLNYPAFTGSVAVDSTGNIYYTSNGTTQNVARNATPTLYRLGPPANGVATLLNSFSLTGWTNDSLSATSLFTVR